MSFRTNLVQKLIHIYSFLSNQSIFLQKNTNFYYITHCSKLFIELSAISLIQFGHNIFHTNVTLLAVSFKDQLRQQQNNLTQTLQPSCFCQKKDGRSINSEMCRLNGYIGDLGSNRRRRIKTDGQAKVVAAVWGTYYVMD